MSVCMERICTQTLPTEVVYEHSLLPILGVSVGRICVYHQPGSTACVCATADGEVLQQVGRGDRRGGGGGGGERGEKEEGIMAEQRMWERERSERDANFNYSTVVAH